MGELASDFDQSEDVVDGCIYFLARLPIYNSVKPFSLRYDPGNDLPATNIEFERQNIKIQNMRSHSIPYETCGFKFCNMSSNMAYEDYEDENLIKTVHFPEVKACLKEALGVSFVEIIDFAQRKRHASFPISTGESYEHMQPISGAHIDVTLQSAQDAMRHALGDQADMVLTSRWQFVNVWHPLKGPLYDWPLAICDASSVDFDGDTMPGDLIHIDGQSETIQVQFNEKQRWYYLAGQHHSEMLIFKNADSLAEKGGTFGSKDDLIYFVAN